MPFKGDEEEENVALKTLIFLWNKDASLLTQYKQRIVQIIENDLLHSTKYHIEEPLLSQIREWAKVLQQWDRFQLSYDFKNASKLWLLNYLFKIIDCYSIRFYQ